MLNVGLPCLPLLGLGGWLYVSNYSEEGKGLVG